MKKRHAISIILLGLHLGITGSFYFFYGIYCQQFVGTIPEEGPYPCHIMNNSSLTEGLMILLWGVALPLWLIAMYAVYGWPKDKHKLEKNK